MSKFRVGDRVRYTGAGSLREDGQHLTEKAVGWEGVVTGNPERAEGGEWDNGEWWCGYLPGNLELIDPAPTPAIDAHYTKYAIQPMEFSLANGLDPAQHTVIKYTVRYRDKGGVRDLRAAIRVLELMIEREEREASDNG